MAAHHSSHLHLGQSMLGPVGSLPHPARWLRDRLCTEACLPVSRHCFQALQARCEEPAKTPLRWVVGRGSCCCARDPLRLPQGLEVVGGESATCRPMRPRSSKSSLHTRPLCGPLFSQQPGQVDTSGAGPGGSGPERPDCGCILTPWGAGSLAPPAQTAHRKKPPTWGPAKGRPAAQCP